MIGRKYAFNTSLMICSIFAIVAGASPNWIVLAVFVALSGFGGGGNLIMDTAVFLEYLPSKSQWLLTFMACWWGVGQIIAGCVPFSSALTSTTHCNRFIAWGFIPNYCCTSEVGCTYSNNKGKTKYPLTILHWL